MLTPRAVDQLESGDMHTTCFDVDSPLNSVQNASHAAGKVPRQGRVRGATPAPCNMGQPWKTVMLLQARLRRCKNAHRFLQEATPEIHCPVSARPPPAHSENVRGNKKPE